MRTVPIGILVALAVVYVLAPGPSHMPLNGMPIGQTGIVVIVTLITVWAWTRSRLDAIGRGRCVALCALIALKITLWAITPETGWLASYFANGQFEPPVERSIDFPRLAATRIDRELSFKETEFPVHFFNDRKFNTGVYREFELPFSVRWAGHITVDEPRSVFAAIAVNGAAEILLDGRTVGLARGLGGQTAIGDFGLQLTPGPHLIEVRYQKPAQTAALLKVESAPGKGGPLLPITVLPFAGSVSNARLAFAAIAVSLLHLAVLTIVMLSLWPGIRRQDFKKIPIVPLVMLLLVAQGAWQSRHLVDHVWTLSGGDDWLNYEMSARDAVLNGLMMSEGGVIGRGQPFSLYPGYAYFVALVHAITGESLAGVVLMNFVMLALATIVAYRIAWLLLGPVAAFGGVLWLLALEQADFVRYYTVTLLSENLYFVLAALTVLFLIKHHRDGRVAHLLAAAVAGALASWTRPSMMLLLPLAMITIGIARWRVVGFTRAGLAAVMFAAAWMIGLMPITLRNYLMSGRPVLLTAGQGATFVMYNMPVNDPAYFKGYDGSLAAAAILLVRMFVDHPLASLENYGTKLGFSLGMVHWMGSGTMHPELIATSVLYFAAIIVLRPLRTLAAMPMHLFVFTHVSILMATMPSNYGYRMILPAFVFMSLGAGALISTALYPRVAARWPALARLVPEQTA